MQSKQYEWSKQFIFGVLGAMLNKVYVRALIPAFP